ncbi:MAG: hypothetical protein H0T46_29705 [Deltaproteobacteria bacterium]|nr:hypothetical protein [Deltaproteobacteria bacterium]
MTLNRLAIALVLCMFGCEPGRQVGANGPDAALSISIDAAPDASETCACGPASCGTRICGRSDCGFPCGECEPGEFCFVGTECQAGVGPGTACVDAFGDRVWEGDRGFRACPTDPNTQQRCQCTGGGPTAWASCDPACIEVCTQVAAGLTCGAPGCGTGEVCCIPTASTDTRSCSATACAQNNYTRACDGPEDCMPGGTCCGGDNLWTATCVPPGSSCGPLEQYCHSGSDCGGTKPYCCPGPVEDMRSCSATNAPSCT